MFTCSLHVRNRTLGWHVVHTTDSVCLDVCVHAYAVDIVGIRGWVAELGKEQN